jgi:segregation and condensation protein B
MGAAAPTKSTPAEDLLPRLEALLFAAGKPLTVGELTDRLGLPDHRPVQRAIRQLTRNYASRKTALEVRRAGDGYSIQVRAEYLPVAHQVAPTELPLRTLRVLALIAYHQPIRQSLLVKMVGEAAYEEVQHLREADFVRAAPRAGTLVLTTSSHFAEHFGLETSDKARIKELLERKLGIRPLPGPVAETPGDGPSEGTPPAGAPELTER